MGLRKISQTITPELTTQTTDYLLGNVIDKIVITTNIGVSTYCNGSTDNNTIHNYTQNGVILGGGYWLYDPLGQFTDFRVGDVIEVKLNHSPFTVAYTGVNIVDKLNNFLIKIDTDIDPGLDDVPHNGYIYNVITPITAVKYQWNFIENSEPINYTSKVDGSTHILQAVDIDATDTVTVVNMDFIGPKPYQIGGATIVGMGVDTTTAIYESKFKIIHTTFITPFATAPQWADVVARNPVSYFDDAACLRYIDKYIAQYQYNDPNREITYQSSQDINANQEGNTGWFNENFNTGVTYYAAENLVYEVSGNPVSGIQLTPFITTNVSFSLKTPVPHTPFSNNNTKFVLSVIHIPDDASIYSGATNPRTMYENFVFDRALQTVGFAAVDGDNAGGNYEVFTNLVATFVSNQQIDISFDVTMGANTVAQILQSTDRHYIIAVSVQDHTLDTDSSDKTTVLVDANNYFIDTSAPGLIVMDTSGFRFLNFPFDDYAADGIANYKGLMEDEVTTRMEFVMNTTGFTGSDTAKILKVESYVIAKNGPSEFILEKQQALNLGNYPVVSGAQAISYSQARNFHIPAAETIRKNYQVNRRTDLDSAGIYGYEIIYPFMLRWETWLPLPGVDPAFYDITQPNNNQNRHWRHYNALGFDIKLRTVITADFNGIPQEYKYDKQFDIFNYDAPAPNIKTYDSTNTELLNAVTGDRYIMDNEDTLVVATFDIGTPATPLLATSHVNIGIEVYQQGGSASGSDGKYRMNSANPSDADTWFKPLAGVGANKVELTASGNDLIAKCYIDFTKLPPNLDYSITARALVE